MLKETRQLFKYIDKFPSRSWTASGDEYQLLLPAPGSAQLRVTVARNGAYLVERLHAGNTLKCDQMEKEPSGWEAGVQFKKNQWHKDLELSKRLVRQAKECNTSSYKSDVDFVTCVKKAVKVQDSHVLSRSA